MSIGTDNGQDGCRFPLEAKLLREQMGGGGRYDVIVPKDAKRMYAHSTFREAFNQDGKIRRLGMRRDW